jgi:nitrilase
MDSVGHYARPELLSLNLDNRPAPAMRAVAAFPPSAAGSPTHEADDADRAIDQRVAVLRNASG